MKTQGWNMAPHHTAASTHGSSHPQYHGRLISDGYPDLERLGVDYYTEHQDAYTRTGDIMEGASRLIDFSRGSKSVAVIGCGPNPRTVKDLIDLGYDAVGVEPVEGSVEAARAFLSDERRALKGTAESLPLGDGTQRMIICESVLEHVDSPVLSAAEAYRALMPGGVYYVYTTNRYRISLTGKNSEYPIPFFNWFPPLLKECYVHQHLHFEPAIGNYTPRPAVHWFTYSELCSLGRNAGFAKFYSLLDLVSTESQSVRGHRLRRWFLNRIRYSPWFRALALTQYGSSIFMFKRPA